MSFKRRRDEADAWVGAAPLKSAEPERPWVGLDPDEKGPRKHFNLRLNRYQLTLLQEVARRTRRSEQQAALHILVPRLKSIMFPLARALREGAVVKVVATPTHLSVVGADFHFDAGYLS